MILDGICNSQAHRTFPPSSTSRSLTDALPVCLSSASIPQDHNTATIARIGHSMPPGRTPVSRLGQTQGSFRGGTPDVGGMLVGDDNRLYGAAFPGSPLDAARWAISCRAGKKPRSGPVIVSVEAN